MIEFKRTTWTKNPIPCEDIGDGRCIVARNVKKQIIDGETFYIGESAIMSEVAYAAYIGAKEVEQQKKNDIIDAYTEELIEEGII